MWENPIQFSDRIECSSSSSSSSDLPQCFKIQLLHSEHVNLSKITEHKRLIFDFLISAPLSHTHNTMFGRVFVLIRKPHLNYVFSDLFVCHSPCTHIRTCSDSIVPICTAAFCAYASIFHFTRLMELLWLEEDFKCLSIRSIQKAFDSHLIRITTRTS